MLARESPDWLLVQGDTTTVMASALAAFHRRVRVGHVEAGLRTGDFQHPFPEEINRRVVDLVSDANFAPTRRAARALEAEEVPAAKSSSPATPSSMRSRKLRAARATCRKTTSC